jgi:hypothetical protein
VISDDDVVEPTTDRPDRADRADLPAAPVRRGLLLPLVLATLLVVAVALAVLQTQRVGDASDERDRLADAAADRQAATLVAAQFAEAFFTYDFEDVDASTATVLGLVTDDYAAQFEAENVPGLQDLFGDVALVSAGVPEVVVVGDIEGDTARALARVDIDTVVQGTRRTLADLSLSIVLRREAGEWRVDEVRIVQAHPEGDDLVGGSTTTTTTAVPSG